MFSQVSHTVQILFRWTEGSAWGPNYLPGDISGLDRLPAEAQALARTDTTKLRRIALSAA
jgi:hypothetical protein